MPDFAALSIQKLGRFGVKLDETVNEKIKRYCQMGIHNLGHTTEYASDKFFPDDRTGDVEFDADIATFESGFNHAYLERWLQETGYRLAGLKEGLDIVCPISTAEFRGRMPLFLAGQYAALKTGKQGKRVILRFSQVGTHYYDQPVRPLSTSRIEVDGTWPKTYATINLLVLREAA
ncbi:MAG: hypothetical protein AAB803_02495 [Patescibacteria group bacterium]